ncbi:hypothetical protein KIMC2_10030 [Xylocopilactobacillus apis]|uniref:Transposase n=1 Tax=Xylocopilactobacillus apis TaxID=2932183 RepID=A0AAU9D1T7_9LACO|nr:hypothetical protein KIMC2_10030 [Xylocopilactobacillus apis]
MLDVLRIQRKSNEIVELKDLNSFDFKNVLAKILGLGTDY